MHFKSLWAYTCTILIEIMTIFDICQKSMGFPFDLFAHYSSSVFHEDMRYKTQENEVSRPPQRPKFVFPPFGKNAVF